MKFLFPMIGLFIFVGLTQSSMTRRIYVRMLIFILVVLLYYFITEAIINPAYLRFM